MMQELELELWCFWWGALAIFLLLETFKPHESHLKTWNLEPFRSTVNIEEDRTSELSEPHMDPNI